MKNRKITAYVSTGNYMKIVSIAFHNKRTVSETVNDLLEKQINESYGSFDIDVNESIFMRSVCKVYMVTPDEIKSQKRPRYLTEARFTLIWLLRNIQGWTLGRIGVYVCRNHATMHHALEMVDSLNKTDSRFRSRFEMVIENLNQ